MTKGHPIPLSVDKLMAKARDIAGTNIFDHEVVEPLTILHRSLCEEACLHEVGAVATQDRLLRLLANRLRLKRDFAAHPDIAEQQIKGPVVIIGLARSGTTKTQKVLAASDDFNWLPFWKTHNPSSFCGKPNESTEARIEEADAYCRWLHEIAPGTKLAHANETFEAEEDSWLTEMSFLSWSFTGYYEVPSYVQWMVQQDQSPQFDMTRDVLKYLQWQGLASADKMWLLKSPTYYGDEAQLFRAFPNTRLVMTHRSPAKAEPSAFKLSNLLHAAFCDTRVDASIFGGGFSMMMNRHLDYRAAHPEMPVLDLSFDELNHSMESAIEKVYAHAGVPLTPASRKRMQQWLDDHPRHKEGKFHYSLEEFGMDKEQLLRDMSRYVDLVVSKFGKMPE